MAIFMWALAFYWPILINSDIWSDVSVVSIFGDGDGRWRGLDNPSQLPLATLKHSVEAVLLRKETPVLMVVYFTAILSFCSLYLSFVIK